DGLRALHTLAVSPRRPGAPEPDDADAIPELPSELDLALRHLLAEIFHRRHATLVNEWTEVERRLLGACRGLAAYTEEECAVQRHVLRRDDLSALKLLVPSERRVEDAQRRFEVRAACRREEVVA